MGSGAAAAAFILIIVIIAIVLVFYAGNQVNAFINDLEQKGKDAINDADTKIPPPKLGSTVCDLTIAFKPKVTGSVTSGNVVHLNEDGGTITQSWSNCKKKTLSWIDMSVLGEYLSVVLLREPDLPTNELGSPLILAWDETFFVDFVLVDENKNKKALPAHTGLDFKVKGGASGSQVLSETIKYTGIEKKSYTLEVYIDQTKGNGNNYRFNDHTFGEPYKQKITG